MSLKLANFFGRVIKFIEIKKVIEQTTEMWMQFFGAIKFREREGLLGFGIFADFMFCLDLS